MKNSKTVIFVGVALALGLVGAYFAAMLGAKPATEFVKVPVASEDLRTMTKLGEPKKKFVYKDFPKDSIPVEGAKGVVLDVEEMKDQFLVKSKTAGQYVMRNELSRTGVVDLDKGMIGYALKVDAESMAGGLVGPGTRVNLSWVGRSEGNKPPMGGFLMTDVVVVAVDAKTARGSAENGPDEFKNPGTVTLQVKPADVTMLARAKALGGFSLSLCNAETDAKGADKPEVDVQLVRYFNSKSVIGGDETVKQPVKTIYVTKAEVAPNTKIDESSFDKYFEPKTLPESVMPQDAIDNKEQIVDRYTTTKLPVGFHVVPSLLSKNPMEEKSSPGVEPVRDDHAVVIVNGSQRPFVAVYRKGVLANGEDIKDPPSKTVPPAEKGPAPKEKDEGGTN